MAENYQAIHDKAEVLVSGLAKYRSWLAYEIFKVEKDLAKWSGVKAISSKKLKIKKGKS